MGTTTRSTKGKRGRNSMDDVAAPAKRPRARRGRVVDVAGDSIESAPTKPRHGLLTPEASRVLESQTESPSVEDQIAPRNKDIFPFLELPAEIRLHIYYMALVRPEPILLHAERAPEKAEDAWTETTCKGPDEGRAEAIDEATSASSSTSSSPTTSSTTAHARALRETFVRHPFNSPTTSRRALAADLVDSSPAPSHPQGPQDPIVPVLLRLNKQISKEARQLLYSENVFTLSLSSGVHTLSTLHQRSRSLIKHVVLTIPSHHDILDGFADLVRLGLRYCWGLKSFRIILEATLPDDSRSNGAGVSMSASTSVYANAFHILRWLPRGCSVVLEGTVSDHVRRVVSEEGRLMNVLDEVSLEPRKSTLESEKRRLIESRGAI